MATVTVAACPRTTTLTIFTRGSRSPPADCASADGQCAPPAAARAFFAYSRSQMPTQSRPASADSNCRTVVTTSFAAPLTGGVLCRPLRTATTIATAATATTAAVASATVRRRPCKRSHGMPGHL